jgi:hypothetical protein
MLLKTPRKTNGDPDPVMPGTLGPFFFLTKLCKNLEPHHFLCIVFSALNQFPFNSRSLIFFLGCPFMMDSDPRTLAVSLFCPGAHT